MSSGLFLGRFQPFHLGHLSAIKQALKEVDFLTIGIGSSQLNHQKDNPFTWEERKEMIIRTLSEDNLGTIWKQFGNNLKSRIKIVPIPDINNNPKWPAHVRSIVPHFDTLFIGNDGIVKELFEKYDDVPLKKIKEEIPVCATKIREAIRNNEEWKKYLPKEVVGYIGEIDGINRVTKL